MIKAKLLKQPNFIIGLLLIAFFGTSCSEEHKKAGVDKQKFNYLLPTDSVSFEYSLKLSKDRSEEKHPDHRYGQNIHLDSNGCFIYTNINSKNELHTFNFCTSEHSYSERICDYRIDAFKIDSSRVYLLYNNRFYIMDRNLNTLETFQYINPIFDQKNRIDFTVENNSNIYRVKDYFVVMYYVVDIESDNSEVYRNTDPLFYYFNKDTSFFADRGCEELHSTFQYFRYPVVTSDSLHLYHAPRVMNCLSKSNEKKTVFNKSIEKTQNNYLTINPEDQYQLSKLKKYRFSSDYNKSLLNSDNHIFLIKEFPSKTFIKEGVREYNHDLQIKKFDKELNEIENYYIKDNTMSYALIKEGQLFIFSFVNQKYYVYEI